MNPEIQLGVTNYSYDINIHGNFGTEALIFSSEERRNEVLKGVEKSL
jgi:hypothetical protein